MHSSGVEGTGKIHEHRGAVDFRDIVDRDEAYFQQHSSQLFVGSLIESLPFRIGILVAILMNSIVIGLQTNKYLEVQYGAVLLGLDRFFHTIFAVEILIKWYYDFLGFWSVGWNIFDFVIISVSFFVPGVGFLSGSRIVHVLRILHATRSLRSISTLRGLQIVMQTVIYSIPDMANVMWLLLICTFVFAILGNSIFGADCPQYFGSVEKTMFSLFICVTQDGWLRIVQELNGCGHNIVGSIYLVVFITIGAFIFANLVVAVVVTNLEWVIAEKNEMEKKFTSKQDAMTLEEMPTSAYDELFKITPSQTPLKFKPRLLDKYLVFLASLEDNFTEFRRLKAELTKIQQEVQALEMLDEVSNDGLLELSNIMAAHEPKPQTLAQQRPSRSNLGGDAITEMLGMLHKSPIQTGHAKSIHHMITQLVQREPSAEPITSRRPSLLMRPTGPEYSRPSQILDPEYSTSRRSSQMTEKEAGSRRPSSQEYNQRVLSAHYGSRRHTVCSVSGTKLHKSPPHSP